LHAYARRTGLRGQTRNSLTELADLEQDLEQVRARGFARDNEELEPGVRCLAAGVYDDAGQLVAGLSISAPAAFLRDEWAHDLVQVAQQISAALGYESAAELTGNGGGYERVSPRRSTRG
jgi:DNA-binding IclR family transcriptional regulator